MLFYRQVEEWLDQYVQSDPPDTIIEMRIEYLNSASHKQLLNILEKLGKLNEGETSVKAKWLYEEDDEEMRESGIEYSESVNIPFELISVEEF